MARPELEQRAAVEHRLQDRPHRVGLARVARDDRQQRLLAPVRRVGGGRDRRQLPDVGRQVGEEAPQLRERVVLVGGLVVDRAGPRLRASAAERLLVGRLAHRRRYHRRAGDEQLAAAAHDHGEVRRHHARRPEPRHGPERRGHHGHDRHVLHGDLHPGHVRHVGEAHLLERLDRAAAARAVDEPRQRQPQVVRHPLRVDHLLPDRGVRGAAADREVIRLHDEPAPVGLALPDDHVGRHERLELAVGAVARDAGQRARLVEGPRIEQPLDPLADGQLARGVLAIDARGAVGVRAWVGRECLAPAQLLELGLPRHGRGD